MRQFFALLLLAATLCTTISGATIEAPSAIAPCVLTRVSATAELETSRLTMIASAADFVDVLDQNNTGDRFEIALVPNPGATTVEIWAIESTDSETIRTKVVVPVGDPVANPDQPDQPEQPDPDPIADRPNYKSLSREALALVAVDARLYAPSLAKNYRRAAAIETDDFNVLLDQNLRVWNRETLGDDIAIRGAWIPFFNAIVNVMNQEKLTKVSEYQTRYLEIAEGLEAGVLGEISTE